MNRIKTDSDVQADVMRELGKTKLGVCVDNGIVTLHGVVERWADKHAAEEAALRVPGVLDVANEIEIQHAWNPAQTDADIARAVRLALEADRRVPDANIHSTITDHGDVTLTGTVDTLAEREAAEQCVLRVGGVRYVTNDLAIDAPPLASSDLHSAIRQALGRHVAREIQRVGVEIVGDTVVLTGSVDSWRERRAVLGAVKGTAGVAKIDDRLHIGS